jgi:hypothetical protein
LNKGRRGVEAVKGVEDGLDVEGLQSAFFGQSCWFVADLCLDVS